MKKSPRFFCQNCGTEVERDAQSCTACGRIFISVCCPQCGHTGSQNLFASGCPKCGYCTKPNSFGINKKKKSARKKNKDVYSSDSLPLWVYGIIAAMCAAAAFSLFMYM